MGRRSQTSGHLRRECRRCGKQIGFGMFVWLTMYLICAKCHRILRAKSVEKHAKKCQNATFNCCDCNDEFDVETPCNAHGLRECDKDTGAGQCSIPKP